MYSSDIHVNCEDINSRSYLFYMCCQTTDAGAGGMRFSCLVTVSKAWQCCGFVITMSQLVLRYSGYV